MLAGCGTDHGAPSSSTTTTTTTTTAPTTTTTTATVTPSPTTETSAGGGADAGAGTDVDRHAARAPRQAPRTTTQRAAKSYPNCAAARAAGVTPLHRGEPGYASHLDGDGDGIACESR